MQPQFEARTELSRSVAHVLETNWAKLQHSSALNSWQMRTLNAVRRCRTAALGSHVDGCTSCGHLRISYNSCRNRHCPKCQSNDGERWIKAREDELLPVPYFHACPDVEGWYLHCPMPSTSCACINPLLCITSSLQRHGV